MKTYRQRTAGLQFRGGRCRPGGHGASYRSGRTAFYLDTDFLFPETFDVRDRIIARYGLKPAQVIQMKSLLTPEQQAAQHGTMLWASQPDQCCELRKIEPLTRILGEYSAWITGIRRDQSPARANAGLIGGGTKIQPGQSESPGPMEQ